MTDPETPGGQRVAGVDAMFVSDYQELRRIAHALNRRLGNVTVNPTGLVGEVYERLRDMPSFSSLSPAHRRNAAASIMRNVLIDAIRRLNAAKRGGSAVKVSLAENLGAGAADTPDTEKLLALDDALTRLAEADSRQAKIVELRYFGGLTVAETAEALNISEKTVAREWNHARAWLMLALGSSSPSQPLDC